MSAGEEGDRRGAKPHLLAYLKSGRLHTLERRGEPRSSPRPSMVTRRNGPGELSGRVAGRSLDGGAENVHHQSH